MNTIDLVFRTEPVAGDPERVEEMVKATGFFREDETAVAVELVREKLEKGRGSGYEFIFAGEDGETVAYCCYGLIPCTLHSYDLYRIVTHPANMKQGIGSILPGKTEDAVRQVGGRGIYLETSSKEQYHPTRLFYERNGYCMKARFDDFYAPGDDKLVYVKCQKKRDCFAQPPFSCPGIFYLIVAGIFHFLQGLFNVLLEGFDIGSPAVHVSVGSSSGCQADNQHNGGNYHQYNAYNPGGAFLGFQRLNQGMVQHPDTVQVDDQCDH